MNYTDPTNDQSANHMVFIKVILISSNALESKKERGLFGLVRAYQLLCMEYNKDTQRREKQSRN